MKFVVSESQLGVVLDGSLWMAEENLGDDPLRNAIADGVNLTELGADIIENGSPRDVPRTLDPPIRAPSKIMAVGLNYRDHCTETDTPVPSSPIEFSKHPSSLTGHMSPIRIDVELTREVDYEVELAVIVGRKCKDLSSTDALDAVAGYTVGNDVSARDLQISDGQWVRAKSFDGFTPLGPWFVTADEIDDPQSLTLETRLDGDVVQDSSTSEMVFSVAELLAFLSRRTTLLPGDIVLTGTPHGCGAFRDPPIFLNPGAIVECSIEKIGTLTNPVTDYN